MRVAYSTVSEQGQRIERIERYIDVYEQVLKQRDATPAPTPTRST